MKFFKHFTDANRGKSLLRIRRELGMAGVGMYWTLVELCGEKLEKEAEETYTKEHCKFAFDLGYLSSALGTKPGRIGKVLGTFQEATLLVATPCDHLVMIEMPKLLEYLDRDSKRARTERVPSAPKRKSKRKIKKEEKEYSEFEQKLEAEGARLANKYREMFKGTTTGAKYLNRFLDQFKTEQDLSDLEKSLSHYRSVLDASPWRDPKTSFESYLGTEKSGFFWRQFIERPDLPVKGGDDLDNIVLVRPGGVA